MRSVFVLVRKDLRRRLAAPFELIIVLAIPLVITGLLALAFGGMRSPKKPEGGMPKLNVVLVDLDQTMLTRMISGATQDPELAERLDVKRAQTREEGLTRLYAEKAAALVVLPKGLTNAVTGGEAVEIELVKNPSQQILPEIAEKGVEMLAFYLSLIARGLGDEAAMVRRMLTSDEWPGTDRLFETFMRVEDKLEAFAHHLFPPLVNLETEQAALEDGENRPDVLARIFASMYPGIMIMGLLFVSNAQMKDLLHERARGTLRRQLTAPVTAGRVLVAKTSAAALVVSVCHGILLIVGSLVFGIRWSPWNALLTASLGVVLMAVGFSATLYSILRSERQADAVGSITVMVLSFLGGAFMPLNDPPAWLATAARGSPAYWGAQVFRAIAGSQTVESLGHAIFVIGGISIGLIATGAATMRLRHLRGAL